MAWVFLLIGIFLAALAYGCRHEKPLWITFAFFAVLNGWIAMDMAATDYPQAYRIVANPFN